MSIGAFVGYFSKALIFGLSAWFFVGCANPLNQATSNRYGDACAEAEDNNRLDIAEQACYRSLVNVDWGNLGDQQKSQRMYNLARIKRKLHKFEEAERLYKDSLAIEEQQTIKSNENIGRRLAELAILYQQRGTMNDGVAYVERLYPLADIFKGSERKTVAAIYYFYSQELNKQKIIDEAEKLSRKSSAMGFDPSELKR
jgi:hypothetical protein